MNSKDQFDLKGKVAIVTGGSGYLGSAICESLASAGADIAIADVEIKKAEARASRITDRYKVRCRAYEMDISRPDFVDKALKNIGHDLGGIDILVNNAYFGAAGSLEKMKEEDWLKGIDGTINGVFRCTQAVLPYMKRGSIINIASMYGIVSPDPGIYGSSGQNNPPNYGAGKAAVIQFTRYAACHLAPKGIRVNSISPGAFPAEKAREDAGFIERLEKKIPMGRIGSPEDLKGIILFLASEASAYVTGVNIPVDGGWTAW